MSLLRLVLASGERLDVHRFSVRESLSEPFVVKVLARSPDASIDLRAFLGAAAELHLVDADRRWCGVCNHARMVQAVSLGGGEAGLSTYEITIVPRLWLLKQRTSYRIFQHLSIPAIVRAVLDAWGLATSCRWAIREDEHPCQAYRVQYGESDLGFLNRLLEEAGIVYAFVDEEGDESLLSLSDAMHERAPRRDPALPFIESPTERSPREYATRVSIAEELRTGAVVFRDHDFRRPAWALLGEATRTDEPAPAFMVERYQPGAFLVGRDDDGWHDDLHGAALARRSLDGERSGACLVSFETNAADLRPGSVVLIDGHPRPELDPDVGLLVTSIAVEGSPHGDWSIRAQAVPASEPYRPARRTPKPSVYGVQSAMVVGPPGQEIHTDEHGRVRVQFPWDREGQGSCWLRVAQGWAGAGLGLFALPRVGQEVLVSFLAGDPDQPIIVGRVSNPLNPAPLKLPEERTQSVWRSASSPGGEGWSEIRIEDARGAELLSMRAERDMGLVVRRDRTEATGGDATSRVEGRRVLYVGQDAHVTTAGELRERVGGTRSHTVEGDQHERVGGLAALGAGVVHIHADGPVVIEGADITLRGPGGFVRIDGGGVTIDGGAVNIQQGGAPGEGPGAAPLMPLVPEQAHLRGPGPRRLPLIGFPGLPPLQVPGAPAPRLPEEATICAVLCRCAADPSPYIKPQICISKTLWAMDDAAGNTSTIKAEVPYDMSKRPPAPIMSRNDPKRTTRRRPWGSKIPDVVIVKDGGQPPTRANMEKVIEIKIPPDYLSRDQRKDYKIIAGTQTPFEVLTPQKCGCPDAKRKQVPQTVPVPQPQPAPKKHEAGELALDVLLLLVLVLNDGVPGGQLDDVMIPPLVARIMTRLGPILRGTAPAL